MSSGDDGTSKEAVSTGKLNQENEHIYNLWCSGRVCCEGMLIQLKVGLEGYHQRGYTHAHAHAREWVCHAGHVTLCVFCCSS